MSYVVSNALQVKTGICSASPCLTPMLLGFQASNKRVTRLCVREIYFCINLAFMVYDIHGVSFWAEIWCLVLATFSPSTLPFALCRRPSGCGLNLLYLQLILRGVASYYWHCNVGDGRGYIADRCSRIY